MKVLAISLHKTNARSISPREKVKFLSFIATQYEAKVMTVLKHRNWINEPWVPRISDWWQLKWGENSAKDETIQME